MAQIKRSGSGLTETDTYHFDHENMSLEDNEVFERMVAEQTLSGRLAAIEEECISVLVAANLPTGPSAYERGFANHPWEILKHRGFAPDSREGFAARLVGDIIFIRDNLQRGDFERAAMLMFFLGVTWSASRIKGQHGKKSRPIATGRKQGRDIDLAREFLRRREAGTFLSDSALKAEIGARLPKPLSRSSAIGAVDRGLKILSG